jgi:hypothetical protein
MKPVGNPKTIGELRKMIAQLPDDMPLHHRGSIGDHPEKNRWEPPIRL